MLSYMLPVEEKPPVAPGAAKNGLQLELGSSRHGPGSPTSPDRPPRPLKSSIISKESSVSSFAGSDITASSLTPTGTQIDKPKLKLLTNGTKHTTLKRVSFGSSKGSMVETLIYESPLQEEPETVSPGNGGAPTIIRATVPRAPYPMLHLPTTALPVNPVVFDQEEAERSKVRVSFFQGARAQNVTELYLDPPFEDTSDHLSAMAAAQAGSNPPNYIRQASTESGWDNPFRPDGDLSREADEIVSLIRGGKPITPTPGGITPQLPSMDETDANAANKDEIATKAQSNQTQAKPPGLKNGTSNGSGGVVSPDKSQLVGGAVDIQHTTPQEPLQPETVVIKKKQKSEERNKQAEFLETVKNHQYQWN